MTADLFSVKDVTDVARDHEAALLFRCFYEVERHLGTCTSCERLQRCDMQKQTGRGAQVGWAREMEE